MDHLPVRAYALAGNHDSYPDKIWQDIFGYGYCGMNVNGTWEFNIYDPKWAWGYQVVEIYDDRIRVYHLRTANTYRAANGIFTVPEAVSDMVEFNL